MNRDPVTTILAGALLISVTLTAGLCYGYLHVARNNQSAQREVARLNALNADKHCRYWATSTRLFPEGSAAGPSAE